MCIKPSREIRECVRSGATMLDRTHPGWWNKINTRILNIASSINCVVGQLSGSHYHKVWTQYCDRPELVGFNCAYEPFKPSPFRELTSAWRQMIYRRRNGERKLKVKSIA